MAQGLTLCRCSGGNVGGINKEQLISHLQRTLCLLPPPAPHTPSGTVPVASSPIRPLRLFLFLLCHRPCSREGLVNPYLDRGDSPLVGLPASTPPQHRALDAAPRVQELRWPGKWHRRALPGPSRLALSCALGTTPPPHTHTHYFTYNPCFSVSKPLLSLSRDIPPFLTAKPNLFSKDHHSPSRKLPVPLGARGPHHLNSGENPGQVIRGPGLSFSQPSTTWP